MHILLHKCSAVIVPSNIHLNYVRKNLSFGFFIPLPPITIILDKILQLTTQQNSERAPEGTSLKMRLTFSLLWDDKAFSWKLEDFSSAKELSASNALNSALFAKLTWESIEVTTLSYSTNSRFCSIPIASVHCYVHFRGFSDEIFPCSLGENEKWSNVFQRRKKEDREESLSTIILHKSNPVFKSVKISGFLSWTDGCHFYRPKIASGKI